MEREMNNRVNT